MRDECEFLGKLIRGKPGETWLRPCSQGVNGGKVERKTHCEGCDKHVARKRSDRYLPESVPDAYMPWREPAGGAVVFNMGCGGIGDGVQGLFAVGAFTRDNPDATVVYRVGALAIPFVKLFRGYHVLRRNEWDVNASVALAGPDRQMNAHFWDDERPGGRPRIERYMVNGGVTGPPEYPRLKDPDGLRALGERWKGYVVICPFSAGWDREYAIQGLATVERLLNAAGYRTVVIHNKPERHVPLVSEQLVDAPAEEVVGLLLNAACVIGIDSGMSHLAAAVRTPTVVLCGQTDGTKVFAGYEGVTVLTGPWDCVGCYWKGPWNNKTCTTHCPAIQGISPQQVVDAVEAAVGRRRRVPLAVVEPTEAELRLADLRAAIDAPPEYPGGSGRGIVTAGEGKFWPMTVAMIKSVRDTGCALPIEVWYRGEAGAVRAIDVAGLGVTLIDADARARHYGDSAVPRGDPDIGGWENKLYALYHTRFETAIWLDADVVVLKDPTFLADAADAGRFATWTDDSAEAAQWLRWSEVWPDGPGAVPGVTSGQVGVNRRLAWPELALAHRICQNSGYYFPRMLGDQDAWRVAFAALGTEFVDLGPLVKIPGVKHLYRFDHYGAPVFLHRSGPKVFPVPDHVAEDVTYLRRAVDAIAPVDEGAALERLARCSVVSADRLAVIRDAVLATNHLPGELAEFGVFRGGTARVIGAFAPGVPLHLFDTFAGMPEDDDDRAGAHFRGEFEADLDEVRATVANPAAVYHVGRFPGPLPPEGTRFRFVHLDCDLYQSVAAGLKYFAPRMVPGGIMLIDDYGAATCPGAKRAVDESGLPVEVTVPPQARVRF